jgi:hypothetical protein
MHKKWLLSFLQAYDRIWSNKGANFATSSLIGEREVITSITIFDASYYRP